MMADNNKQLLISAGFSVELAEGLAHDLERIEALKNTDATAEERAEILQLASELMTLRLIDAGVIPNMGDTVNGYVGGMLAQVLGAVVNE